MSKLKKEKETGYQVLHSKDNGELVLISMRDGVKVCCKICKMIWVLPMPYPIGMNDDWKEYKEKK